MRSNGTRRIHQWTVILGLGLLATPGCGTDDTPGPGSGPGAGKADRSSSGPAVTTDRTVYAPGEAVEANIVNTLDDSIVLDGCSVFYWEQEIADGSWWSMTPTQSCVWEGYTRELKPAETHTEVLVPIGEGTFRLVAYFGVACEGIGPISSDL